MRELPSWDECEAAVKSGKFSPLHELIYNQSPAGNFEEAEFRRQVFAAVTDSFQWRVHPWMQACFGSKISADGIERYWRFLEEALELVQALGCSQVDAHRLVDYTYDRAIGDPRQEVGGVMVTLAALCLANDFDMHDLGEVELERVWTMIETIRRKQATKPSTSSPLPE